MAGLPMSRTRKEIQSIELDEEVGQYSSTAMSPRLSALEADEREDEKPGLAGGEGEGRSAGV